MTECILDGSIFSSKDNWLHPSIPGCAEGRGPGCALNEDGHVLYHESLLSAL